MVGKTDSEIEHNDDNKAVGQGARVLICDFCQREVDLPYLVGVWMHGVQVDTLPVECGSCRRRRRHQRAKQIQSLLRWCLLAISFVAGSIGVLLLEGLI